jgi:outer membrane biosynthesis protein TonB
MSRLNETRFAIVVGLVLLAALGGCIYWDIQRSGVLERARREQELMKEKEEVEQVAQFDAKQREDEAERSKIELATQQAAVEQKRKAELAFAQVEQKRAELDWAEQKQRDDEARALAEQQASSRSELDWAEQKRNDDVQAQGDRQARLLPSDGPQLHSELGAYMAKVRRAIGSIWYPKVEGQMQLVSVGTVRLRVTIHADGTVDVIPLGGDNVSDSAQILRSISLRSIEEAAPFDRFTDSLKAKYGDSYTDEFTFQVYQE